MSYTTYDLEELFEKGQKTPENEMYDKNTAKETLDNINKDIYEKFNTLSEFAKKYGMAPNYLSEVFSGKKNAKRDYFLICFVALGYDIEKTRTSLRHLGLTDFSVKDPRDNLIFEGIRNGLKIDEINDKIADYNTNHTPEEQIPILWTGKE